MRTSGSRRTPVCWKVAGSLETAVNQEIALMAPVRAQADIVIDSTRYSTARLRGELLRLFSGGQQGGEMQVSHRGLTPSGRIFCPSGIPRLRIQVLMFSSYRGGFP